MSNHDNGGPAFPQGKDWQNDMEIHINSPERYGAPPMEGNGMTLRDYFAAKAMQGEIAASAGGQRPSDLAELAGFSFAMADAMLEAREIGQ